MHSAAAERGPGWGAALDAAGAGLWLGLAQVSLTFALLAGADASATLFFALTTSWLTGGALGAWAVRAPGSVRVGAVGATLAAALLALAGTRWALAARPYGSWGAAAGLAAGALSGAYGGVFFGSRAGRWARAAGLLFWENNGFVIGWAGGTAALFYRPDALHAGVLVLGMVLIAAEYARARPLR